MQTSEGKIFDDCSIKLLLRVACYETRQNAAGSRHAFYDYWAIGIITARWLYLPGDRNAGANNEGLCRSSHRIMKVFIAATLMGESPAPISIDNTLFLAMLEEIIGVADTSSSLMRGRLSSSSRCHQWWHRCCRRRNATGPPMGNWLADDGIGTQLTRRHQSEARANTLTSKEARNVRHAASTSTRLCFVRRCQAFFASGSSRRTKCPRPR